MTVQPTLSILIVSYNVRGYLDRCLASLYGHEQGVDFEVIVVDNASSDDSVAHLRAEWPQVRVVENRVNVGFPQGNNQALAQASGRYVLYLNPDTEVGADTLRVCVATLESDPSIGMVGCRLLYPDGGIQYECARSAYRLGDLAIESLYLHRFFPSHPVFGRQILGDWDHRTSRDVEGISGAFMMLPRWLAEELGGMATEVFAYHEDMDLALRVRQRGLRVRYVAEVTTVHHTSRSSIGRWLDPGWALLELETNSRLIRQLQGAPAAAAARALYFARALTRLAVAAVGAVVPGRARLREKYPTVFSARRHALQAAWALSPRLVAHRVPRAPRLEDVPAPIVHAPRVDPRDARR